MMNILDSAVEIQFSLRTGSKRNDNTELTAAPPCAYGRLPRVAQVMALAIQFQDMIQRGEARDYADLARLACLTRERMSQIMKLVWLAPVIQQEILYLPGSIRGRYPISELGVRKLAALLSWDEQRTAWDLLRGTPPRTF